MMAALSSDAYELRMVAPGEFELVEIAAASDQSGNDSSTIAPDEDQAEAETTRA
jgi:hypothetical protein